MDSADPGRRHFRPGRLSRRGSREKTPAHEPRLRDILGIETPILSKLLGSAADPEHMTAISYSDGYGVIPLSGDPVEKVRDGIRSARELSRRNYAANLNMSLDYRDALRICIEERVRDAFRSIEQAMECANQQGARLFPLPAAVSLIRFDPKSTPNRATNLPSPILEKNHCRIFEPRRHRSERSATRSNLSLRPLST